MRNFSAFVANVRNVGMPANARNFPLRALILPTHAPYACLYATRLTTWLTEAGEALTRLALQAVRRAGLQE